MPLKLNVGLARTIGEANNGSRGASVNLDLELDSGLIQEPDKLHEKIRQLFSLVKTSLTEELNNGSNQQTSNPSINGGMANGTYSQPSQNGETPRLATVSQVKALFAIAKSKKLTLSQVLRDRFQAAKAEDLSIRQASQLIDEMKNGGPS